MKEYKPRDKITQKMTRDGAVEVNETKQTAERISKREQETDLQKTPEQQAAQDAAQLTTPIPEAAPFPSAPFTASKADTGTAERIMGHLDAAHTRKASKKAVQKAQAEMAAETKSSRLKFTEEELSAPELEKYIRKSDKAADRLDAARAAIPKEKKLVKTRTFDEATGKGTSRPDLRKRPTRYPAPHRKRAFLSTTRYIRLKRTIRVLRGRTNRKNLPSAAQSTGQGNSNRATAAIS